MRRAFLPVAVASSVLCAAASAQQFGGNATLTPSAALTPQGPLPFTPAKIVNPVDYGARCDGVTDDTAALSAWAAAAAPNSRMVVPGICVFKGPIAFPRINDVAIEGAGHPSQLLYAGSATTGNIVTIGTSIGNCSVTGWSIHGVRLMSNTVMTGGDALLLNDVCESDIDNVDVGGDLGGNQNWFNAVHFNGGNAIRMRGYSFSGSGAAEIINGDSSIQFTDMFQVNGKLTHSGKGLVVGGNVGGLIVDQTDILLNGANVVVDQSQAPVPNSQLFFLGGAAIDATNNGLSGASGIGLEIKDAGSPNSVLTMVGPWLASSGKQCLEVDSGTNWQIDLVGGNVVNCHPPSAGTGAVENDSTTAVVNITGTHFWVNNGGSGSDVANNGGSAGKFSLNGVQFGANANGNVFGYWSGSYVDVNGNLYQSAPVYATDFSISNTASFAFAAPNDANGVNVKLTGNGSTTPSKYIRVYNGALNILSSSYGAALLTLTDSGAATWSGAQNAPAFVAGGSGAPTATGSCVINNQAGGNTGGTFKFNGACAGGTITFTFATIAPVGWACVASDMTTPTDTIKQTGYSAATAIFTATGASGDQATFSCMAF